MPLPKLFFPFIAVAFFLIGHPSFGQAAKQHEFYLFEDSTKKLTGETALEFFNQGKFWGVLNFLPQITNLHKTDVAPGNKVYDEHEALETRLLIGYSF